MLAEWIVLVCCFYCNCLYFIATRSNNENKDPSIPGFGTASMIILDAIIILFSWQLNFKGLYTIFTFVVIIFSFFANIRRLIAIKKNSDV